eukprot:jgi/Botrbrau1/15651/Bobra.4_1s0035.1
MFFFFFLNVITHSGGINKSRFFCLTISVSSPTLNAADSYQKCCELSNVFTLGPFWASCACALSPKKLGLASWAIPAYISGPSTEHCGTVSLVCIISHLGKKGWQVPIWGPYV